VAAAQNVRYRDGCHQSSSDCDETLQDLRATSLLYEHFVNLLISLSDRGNPSQPLQAMLRGGNIVGNLLTSSVVRRELQHIHRAEDRRTTTGSSICEESSAPCGHRSRGTGKYRAAAPPYHPDAQRPIGLLHQLERRSSRSSAVSAGKGSGTKADAPGSGGRYIVSVIFHAPLLVKLFIPYN
jgi:hypothetical protein